MIRLKPLTSTELNSAEISSDSDDKLLLIDDAMFVSAFAEAGQRRGTNLVCIRCFDPARTLRAVLVLLDRHDAVDESAGSVGFCRECYHDLAELMLHDAVLRARKSTDS